MHVINSYNDYFNTVREFNRAPAWQKELLLRGSLLAKCREIQPVSARHRLQSFWAKEAEKFSPKLLELKTWG